MESYISFGFDAVLRRGLLVTRTNTLLLSTLALMAATGNVAAEVEEGCKRADLFLHSGTVYTADAGNSKHQAIVINDGRFEFVGTDQLAEQLWCDAERVIDLKGATVFPGFTDSHQHLEGIGRRTKTLSLFGIDRLDKTVAAIERWAAEVPSGGWVLGRGWIEREWQGERRFLTRWDVDRFTE